MLFVTPFVLYFFSCYLFAVVNCTDPGHLENSIRQVQPSGPHRFSFGTTVSYQCSHGYYLLGTHVLTCQGDGTWDRPLPQCLCKLFRAIPLCFEHCCSFSSSRIPVAFELSDSISISIYRRLDPKPFEVRGSLSIHFTELWIMPTEGKMYGLARD